MKNGAWTKQSSMVRPCSGEEAFVAAVFHGEIVQTPSGEWIKYTPKDLQKEGSFTHANGWLSVSQVLDLALKKDKRWHVFCSFE